MYRIIPLFLSIFLAIIPVISMEHRNISNTSSELITVPVEASIIIVSCCKNKNALRQTCKSFRDLASRIKNENILVQPQLHLNQEALDRYLLYYGALGNTAIVHNLLNKGANPNACEDNGITLLHYAVQCGYDDIKNILLERPDWIKLDLSSIKRPGFLNEIARNQFGEHLCLGCASKPEKLLHTVIQQGWYAAVEYLLAQNVNANATNKKEESALYCATQAGYISIMKLLISKGACVNGATFYGYNKQYPLQIAAKKGHTSAVQLLIDYDADVNIFNNGALRNACEHGYMQIFKILLVQRAGVIEKFILHKAVREGYTPIVKMLLENGVDVNAAEYIVFDNYKSRPLDLASNEDIKNLLIAHGGRKTTTTEWVKDGCVIQ